MSSFCEIDGFLGKKCGKHYLKDIEITVEILVFLAQKPICTKFESLIFKKIVFLGRTQSLSRDIVDQN